MTTADEEKAFLARILACPEDDTDRLVFADWLDEQGDAARAEFIRVQVALSLSTCRCDDLRRREAELWGYAGVSKPRKDGIMSAFTGTMPGWAVILGGQDDGRGLTEHYPWAVVRRGFVDEVRLTSEAFLGGPCQNCQHWAWDGSRPIEQAHSHCDVCRGKKVTTPGLAPAIFSAHPITKVVLTSVPQLAIGPVVEKEGYGLVAGSRAVAARWWVAGPGLDRQQMGLSYTVNEREVMAQDRMMCRREFYLQVENARRPENVLKAWWPKVTFRVELPSPHAPFGDFPFGEYAPLPTPNVGTS